MSQFWQARKIDMFSDDISVPGLTLKYLQSELRHERSLGCVEVDIRVPDHLKETFSEMCPIFTNTDISRADIGEFMKNYAEEHGIMALLDAV